jgi:hypothetical protein
MMRFRSDALSFERAIEAKGGTAKLLRKGHRRLPAKALEAHNRPLRPVRARIEKIFGTWKRSYRFRCMRWLLRRRNSKSISPPSPTISNAIDGCKSPERSSKQPPAHSCQGRIAARHAGLAGRDHQNLLSLPPQSANSSSAGNITARAQVSFQ